MCKIIPGCPDWPSFHSILRANLVVFDYPRYWSPSCLQTKEGRGGGKGEIFGLDSLNGEIIK